MVSKFKKIFLGFVFINCLSIAAAWSAELTLPPLANTIKIAEKKIEGGFVKGFSEVYETSMPQSKVLALYKQELLAGGWQEVGNGLFRKDQYMTILVFMKPVKKSDKLRFSVVMSKAPTQKEVELMRKVNPDKLKFMPTYPGCVQTYLWEAPNGMGVGAGYETPDSVKDVVFFFKSAMLNYGWTLVSEKPVVTKPIDCPQCRKMFPAGKGTKPSFSGVSTQGTLTYKNKNRESCNIVVTNAKVDMGEASQAPSTTRIRVNYYVPIR